MFSMAMLKPLKTICSTTSGGRNASATRVYVCVFWSVCTSCVWDVCWVYVVSLPRTHTLKQRPQRRATQRRSPDMVESYMV